MGAIEKKLHLLLVEHLEPIIRRGKQEGNPDILRAWLRRQFEEEELGTAILDEAVILPRVGGIITDAERIFTTQPEGMHELRERYAQVQGEHPNVYLALALPRQKTKLTQQLRETEPRAPISKELSRVNRLLDLVKKKIDERYTDAHRLHIVKLIRMRALRSLRRLAVHRRNLFLEDEVEGTSQYLAAYFDIYDEERVSFREDSEQHERLEERREILLEKLKIQQRIYQVLAATDGKLVELAERQAKPACGVPEGISTKRGSEPHFTEGKGSAPPKAPAKPGKGSMTTPASKPTIAMAPPGPVSHEATFDPFSESIKKLRRAIVIANRMPCSSTRMDKKRIRLLTSGFSRRALTESWIELFETQLGFQGEIEFVTYEQLAVATDVSTPLVVPDGMFIHHNLWDHNRFQNLCRLDVGRPNLLLNHLRQG